MSFITNLALREISHLQSSPEVMKQFGWILNAIWGRVTKQASIFTSGWSKQNDQEFPIRQFGHSQVHYWWHQATGTTYLHIYTGWFGWCSSMHAYRKLAGSIFGKWYLCPYTCSAFEQLSCEHPCGMQRLLHLDACIWASNGKQNVLIFRYSVYISSPLKLHM